MSISNGDLDRLCDDFCHQYGITLAICEIFGKRWSFIAGNGDSLYAGERIRLNEKYGLIADVIPETIKEDLLGRLKTILHIRD
jgi:hypothetical protein